MSGLRRLIDEPLLIFLSIVVIVFTGWMAWKNLPVDAIPNVGEHQVIVSTEWPGRSPKDVEDQITYPISASMLGIAGAKSVRGSSMLGSSFVQITFDDDIDFYWARSRVAEKLASLPQSLPPGVSPMMGPDATALGQIFQYVLEPSPDRPKSLEELRTMQDYIVKYALQAVEGVSEVASIGGHIRSYQIEIDPSKLKFQDLPLDQVITALKSANQEISARTLEQSSMEFIIRARGYLGQNQGPDVVIQDIEQTIVTSRSGVPIRIKDLGFVNVGTAFRHGALDLNGHEAVGGVVVMRMGEKPQSVIDRVKQRIQEIEPSLDGVKITAIYDRTNLISETIQTLTRALKEEILITFVVILIFLLNIRISLIVALTLPLAVLLCFIVMRALKLDANIMSLAGIAIAIGNIVDMAIVITENISRHWNEAITKNQQLSSKEKSEIIWQGSREVIPAIMTATATTVVSFLPVFFLTGRDGKLFIPLAWTKTIAMLSALILAIAMLPALCRWLLSNRASSEQADNKVTRAIKTAYRPLLHWALDHPRWLLAIPPTLFITGVFLWLGVRPLTWPITMINQALGLPAIKWVEELERSWSGIQTDDWIPLDEGSFFYMPSLYPAVSFQQAMQLLQTQGQLIRQIPEVDQVLGKIGRVESALDPAPLSMIETFVSLKSEDEWRKGMTQDKIWQEINQIASLPGVTPASLLQPIEGRVVMLQSGIRAPMAIRIYGDSLEGLAQAAQNVRRILLHTREVDSRTVNADLVMGKPYAEFHIDRRHSARFGLSIQSIQDSIETTIAGKVVDMTIEGRQRYPIEVRYPLSYRQSLEQLGSIPLITPQGALLQLKDLASMETSWGPAMISSENGRLVAHVAFAPSGVAGSLATVNAVNLELRRAQQSGQLQLPAGYQLEPVGSFMHQIEANQKLKILIPIVVLINLLLIYYSFRSLPISLIVFTGIPIAFGGGMILVALTGVKINTAVWIGFIALFGIATDDGVLQATYMRTVFQDRIITSWKDIREAIEEAAMMRVRPCVMTSATTLVALLPVLLSQGTGADVAKAMAIPIFGGMLLALLVLLVVPVLYAQYHLQKLKMEKGVS